MNQQNQSDNQGTSQPAPQAMPQPGATPQQTSWAAPPVGFVDAIKICFRKYVDFSGRASRSEYWKFWLFCIIILFFVILPVCGMIGATGIILVAPVLSLPLVIPSLAAGSRRLHDTGKSGLWQLLPFGILFLGLFTGPIGVIPLLILSFVCALVLFLPQGQNFPNRFDYPNMPQAAYGQPPFPGQWPQQQGYTPPPQGMPQQPQPPYPPQQYPQQPQPPQQQQSPNQPPGNQQ